MSQTLTFATAYTKASGAQQVKATGLTVTVSVWSVLKADGTQTLEVNAASATELNATNTSGVYFYRLTGADLTTKVYFAVFHTSDATVQQVDIASMWPDFAEAVAKDTAGALSLTVNERAAVADKHLGRNLAGGSDGGRTVKDALRASRNRVAFDVPTAGQFTIFAEDDSTPAWTGTYTSAAGNPVTAIDPT